jgi:hypothetical protein
MWYDIFINCVWGFHPVAVVSKLVQKSRRDKYSYEEKQYTKQEKNTEHTKRK